MTANVATLIALILILLAAGWIVLRLFTRAYIKTTAATAFVRTGGLLGARSAQPLVVMNGAAWVFGFLHRIKWVSLETMTIEVRHLEEDALITSDPQYIDLEARFFIKVGHNPESISIAARTIGGETVDEGRVRRLVEPKLNGAVRDVASTFSLKNLLEKRADFIKQVQERLRTDLAENGLVLESVSILTLRPTLQGHFSTEDILGAQVARANAVIIEQALTDKNKLEKLGALERARQDAEAEREQLGIEEAIERERAERTKNIALVRSSEESAARVVQEQKREEAEIAHILTERALQEGELENERRVALLREQLQQAVEIERVLREQAVALADEERQKQIAEATAGKLAATKVQIEADAEREQALQAAMTQMEKSAAERDAEIELINARLEAEKQQIEGKSQAETTRTRAEAELDAAKMAAIGEREQKSAVGLADVQVALERIKVLEREADAIRLKLVAEADGDRAKAEAYSSHEGVIHNLELARMNSEALKAIEIARAQALGQAISSMKMNLFGDAAMANRLLQLVTTAQSSEHIYNALPGAARSTLEGLAERFAPTRRTHENGKGQSLADALDTLVTTVTGRYPATLEDNVTVGQLGEMLNRDGSSLYNDLRPVFESAGLRDLPIKSVFALAQIWLGWKGATPD